MLRRGYFTPPVSTFRKNYGKIRFFDAKAAILIRSGFRSVHFSARVFQNRNVLPPKARIATVYLFNMSFIISPSRTEVKKKRKFIRFLARLVFTWNLHYDIIESIVCRRAVLCLSAANNVKFRGKRNRYEEKTKKFPYRREWNRSLRDSARSFVCG